MEHFSSGDVITPIWATTFYDLESRPYRATPGGVTYVLEAEAGPAWAYIHEHGEAFVAAARELGVVAYAVTLLLPDGKIRWYRSMDPRYWRKVSTTSTTA